MPRCTRRGGNGGWRSLICRTPPRLCHCDLDRHRGRGRSRGDEGTSVRQHLAMTRVLAAAAALLAAACLVTVPGTAARAATGPQSNPLAIGQATAGDLNVLAVDDTASGTPVRIRPFASGTVDTTGKQRWTFESIPAGGAVPPLTYRIRNVASGLCLEKPLAQGDVDGATVDIAACQDVTHQYWYLSTDHPYPGWALQSVRDNRCLDLYVSNDGAPAIVWGCSAIYSTQQWRTRTGAFDCAERSATALCFRPGQPTFGLLATSRQYPMTFTGPDHNNQYNYIGWKTLNSQGSDAAFDYFELGWHGEYDQTAGTTAYRAYWSEEGIRNGELFYQEHSLADRPGGADPNGRNHSYLALGRDDGQWNVLYDYNIVGTTLVAEGQRLGYLETGLLHQYNNQTFLATPFENRLQVFIGNSVWRRAYLGETSTIEDNTCYAPPNQLSSGEPNTPPWRYTSSVGTKPATADTPALADYIAVGKPASAAAPPSVPGALPADASVYHGVDQRRLAACMATDADNCLATVPGLAACVATQRICNVTGGPAGGPRAGAGDSCSPPVWAPPVPGRNEED